MSFADTPSTSDVPIPRRTSISNQQPVTTSLSSVRSSIRTCLCQPHAQRIYLITATVIWMLVLSMFLFSLVVAILAEAGESWSKMVTAAPGFYWVVISLGVVVTVVGLTLAGYVVWKSRYSSDVTPTTPITPITPITPTTP